MCVSFPTGTTTFPLNTLHHEGILTHVSFPSSTSTREFITTTLHNEWNLTHFIFPTGTSTFPSNTLHHGVNVIVLDFCLTQA